METVAFYSYKGGVGRSLLLANTARFLAASGKGVVALDFDFEAPGLHYKLEVAQPPGSPTFQGGAVPYLLATTGRAVPPPPLEDHMIAVPVPMQAGGWLRLMPAGPAPHQSYWAANKELGDRLRLGDPSGHDLMALLDLKARIAYELTPDYLLIDARAGVTYLGGLAAGMLADTVVCMSVTSRESFDGVLEVARALKVAPRLSNQQPIRLVPVLSRAATTDHGHRIAFLHLMEIAGTIFTLPTEDLDASETIAESSPLWLAYRELFRRLFPTVAGVAETRSNSPTRENL